MGFTVLHGLAALGRADEVRRLVDNEWVPQPWEVDEWGSSALHYAAEGGHVATIALLLEIGLDAEAQDRLGHTALILSAERGHDEAVQMLLNSGADANARNRAGRTALHQAVDEDPGAVHPDVAVAASPSRTTLSPLRGKTPQAAKVPLEDMLSTQKKGRARAPSGVHGGVNTWRRDDRAQNTDAGDEGADGEGARPREDARERVVRALLLARADVDRQDGYGYTPLHLAAERGRACEVALLLDARADTSLVTVFRRTAAQVAASDAVGDAILAAQRRNAREQRHARARGGAEAGDEQRKRHPETLLVEGAEAGEALADAGVERAGSSPDAGAEGGGGGVVPATDSWMDQRGEVLPDVLLPASEVEAGPPDDPLGLGS